MRIRNALISVSDKSGLEELAPALVAAGAALYSTGGTASALRDMGIAVNDVSRLTGFAEWLDGRVKTLHPHVHGAILADARLDSHRRELEALGLPKLDLVVVNFYPFVAAGDDDAIAAAIDIGGPAMARAAAKNWATTTTLTDPADYPIFVAELKRTGGVIGDDKRRLWAAKAFVAVASLDAAIANAFAAAIGGEGEFPRHRFLHLEKIVDLRYGENPHQAAACYGIGGESGGLGQLQGAPVSHNNLLDAHSACMAVNSHVRPAAAIVKHGNPCGIAVAETSKSAFHLAHRTDPVAAYGGVVAFNRSLDGETAALLRDGFWEVIVAPQFDAAAKAALAIKDRSRLLLSSLFAGHAQSIAGNDRMLLLQDPDEVIDGGDVVSSRRPSEAERDDLMFAWRAAAAVKSNAVVVAKDGATLGIGAGQMSRVDSARLACEKAGNRARGGVAASDGFFPFVDGLEILAAAGVAAVIQPGGSKNDADVIAAADARDMAMIFTGRRHFRH